MEDIQPLLLTCFQATFPKLDQATLLTLKQQDYPAWDSLASITLVRLIEEQFGLEIDLFDLEDLDSFAAMEAYIRKEKG